MIIGFSLLHLLWFSNNLIFSPKSGVQVSDHLPPHVVLTEPGIGLGSLHTQCEDDFPCFKQRRPLPTSKRDHPHIYQKGVKNKKKTARFESGEILARKQGFDNLGQIWGFGQNARTHDFRQKIWGIHKIKLDLAC